MTPTLARTEPLADSSEDRPGTAWPPVRGGRLAARVFVTLSILPVLVTVAAHTIRGWEALYSGLAVGVNSSVAVAYLGMGLLLIERRRAGAVGPLLLALGAIYAWAGPLDWYIGNVRHGMPAVRMAFGDLAALAFNACGYPGSFALSLAMLLFPSGRLLSRQWRVVVALGASAAIAGVVALTFGPLSFRPVWPMFHSPFGIPGFPRRALETLADIGSIAFRIAAVASLVLRWRIGDAVQRAQSSWLLAAIAVTALMQVAERLTEDRFDWTFAWVGLAGNATTLLIPLAMGIAIVRYRLFEFDRLVSRTIAYAAITLVLAAIFAAASVGFGAVLGSLAEGEAISATIATLIAATSFSTLRRRVQPFVDRRFDRARYDGVRAVEGLSARLRDDVELDRVRGDVLGVIDATVHPAHLTVWLRPPRAERSVTP